MFGCQKLFTPVERWKKKFTKKFGQDTPMVFPHALPDKVGIAKENVTSSKKETVPRLVQDLFEDVGATVQGTLTAASASSGTQPAQRYFVIRCL